MTPTNKNKTIDEIDNKIDDLLLQFTKGYGALTVTFSGNIGDNARVFQLPYNVLREAIKLLVLDERQVTETLITEARIDEVEGIINMPPDFDDFYVYLPYRLTQLKENN